MWGTGFSPSECLNAKSQRHFYGSYSSSRTLSYRQDYDTVWYLPVRHHSSVLVPEVTYNLPLVRRQQSLRLLSTSGQCQGQETYSEYSELNRFEIEGNMLLCLLCKRTVLVTINLGRYNVTVRGRNNLQDYRRLIRLCGTWMRLSFNMCGIAIKSLSLVDK